MALTKSLSFSLGRKRVLISDNNICCNLEHFRVDFRVDFQCSTPMKKFCARNIVSENDFSFDNSTSLLESLPQELLIKIVCGVDHDDLKHLFFVSKTVRDAAIIAKNCHFAYSTPSKTRPFRSSIDMLNNLNDSTDIEAPSAPKPARKMKRKRFDPKKLDGIAVALFTDETVVDEMQRWPRRSLFTTTIDG